MATNYKSIHEENEKRFGTEVGDYGHKLLADRYGDRTHFVYELLQNAHDALCWRSTIERSFSRDVTFELKHDGLFFRHFGLPFAEQHVRGICNIAQGTKETDLTAIGKHGVGFKSVYAYTDHPEVHSGDEHFVIDSFVLPRPCSVRWSMSEDETLFFFPFDRADVLPEKAYSEIANRLKRLGPKTLLFLRNVDSISWATEDGTRGQYLREETAVCDFAKSVRLLGQDDETGCLRESQWLVFYREVCHEGRPAGFVEIAFASELSKEGALQITSLPESSPLVVFFPTEKETHLNFLLQGPYRTTLSRDSIPIDDPWNMHLISLTADFLCDALRTLRNLQMLNALALQAFVFEPTKYRPEAPAAMFAPIVEAIRSALINEKLIPRFGGGQLPGKSALLGTEKLRALLSTAQLREIANARAEADWVDEGITTGKELGKFLVQEIGVAEFDSDEFIRQLTPEFLRAQSDKWIAHLYSFLWGLPYLRKELRQKEIIRLDDGTQVAPFDFEGRPNAYLPGTSPTQFPVVKLSICEVADALAFLTELGLKEADPVDDIIYNILPRYEARDVPLDDELYQSDINRVVAAFATDSKSQRDKLLRALRPVPFIMAMDAGTGLRQLSSPAKLYLPTDSLKELFSGVQGQMLVDDSCECLQDARVVELLEACGANPYFKPIKADEQLSREERRELRLKAGHEDTSGYKDREENWALLGLDQLLGVMPSLSLEVAARKAELLWECLGDMEAHNGQTFFAAKYSWTHYGSYQQTFPPRFIRQLNSTAWVPSPQGDLQRPEFVLFESLGWDHNPFLESKILFRCPVEEELARQTGIEPELLQTLRKYNIRTASDLNQLLGIRESGSNEKEGKSCRKTAVDDAVHAQLRAAFLRIGSNSVTSDSDGTSLSIPMGEAEVKYKLRLRQQDGRASEGGARRSDGVAQPAYSLPSIKSTTPHNYHTYIAANNDLGDDKETCEENSKLEQAAIELIRHADGPLFAEIRQMPPNNEGYDLIALNENGEVQRLIEVKALSCAWKGRPVTLSNAQFRMAQSVGEKYWLYVVERAGQGDAKIYRVSDPATKARYFTFDDGWEALSESASSAFPEPSRDERS